MPGGTTRMRRPLRCTTSFSRYRRSRTELAVDGRGARAAWLRHRDDADPAGLRRTADVVAQPHGRILHLAFLGLPLQLLVVLVDHADAGRAGGVAEGLEPAVGVHRQLAVECERAAGDVLLGGALLAEAELLVGQQLGQRE